MWDSDWKTGDAYVDKSATSSVSQISAIDSNYAPSYYDGQKYPGGLEAVDELFGLDREALVTRSNKLYHTNGYFRGIVRRIVTNQVATGLKLEASPEKALLGISDEHSDKWSNSVEARYEIYNSTPEIIDYKKQRNGGELQRQIKIEAIVGGDCLVVNRQSPKYRLPTVQIISGSRVMTPYYKFGDDNIIDGVQLDAAGNHVSFWVADDSAKDGFVNIKARGANTGRLQAKLIYGCDKREDGVRGIPLLGVAIQPLSEIDRYRDSTQRRATLNSCITGAIKRDGSNKRKSGPAGGASRRDTTTVDVVTDSGGTKQITYAEMVPGMNLGYLEPGEEAVFYSNNGADTNFGAFEAAILMGIAWALEIPPEILLLSFNKNYSASQAALNEFAIYLKKEREKFGADYCDFLYQDWFLSMVLLNRINAGSYLSDLYDVNRWDYARAWTISDWSGHMKPSTDMLKQVKGYKEAIDAGLITRGVACREMYGRKYTKVIDKLKEENISYVEAMRPLMEFQNEFGTDEIEKMQSLKAVV